MMRRFPLCVAACVVVGATFGLGSCSSDDFVDLRPPLLESWTQDVILSGYAAFIVDAEALETQTIALCAEISNDSMTAARDAWRTARSSWKRMDAFQFGPYTAFPERLGPRVDFYPVRGESIEELIEGTDEITVELIGSLGTSVRGLPVLEYLLFAGDEEVEPSLRADPRRCDMIQAVAADLVDSAEAMHAAWDPANDGYALALTGPYTDPEIMNPREAVGAVVNRMGFLVENLREEKLGAPLGSTESGPLPGEAESIFSGHSVEDILVTLDMLGLLFNGAEAEDALGLVDLLEERERGDVREAFLDALSASRTAVESIPHPLTDAVVDAPATVQAAIDALGELQRAIQVDIVGALDLSLAFNDNDGD